MEAQADAPEPAGLTRPPDEERKEGAHPQGAPDPPQGSSLMETLLPEVKDESAAVPSSNSADHHQRPKPEEVKPEPKTEKDLKPKPAAVMTESSPVKEEPVVNGQQQPGKVSKSDSSDDVFIISTVNLDKVKKATLPAPGSGGSANNSPQKHHSSSSSKDRQRSGHHSSSSSSRCVLLI